MTSYGISIYTIIPVRAEPSEKSEMCTQLLFGESYEVLEEFKTWINIKSGFDNYEGWIDKKMYFPLTYEIYIELNHLEPVMNQEIVEVFENREYLFPILILPGSTLFYNDDSKTIIAGSKSFYFKNNASLLKNNNTFSLLNTAYKYMNAPYLWGGRTPFGIDCSGFTQIVYKINGINLPRDASQQVEIGDTIDFIEEVKTGDLAFFDDDEGNIVHVGIILEDNKIIHASGKVRIDQLERHSKK